MDRRSIKTGTVVTVKSGYGRNYLLPQGKAVLATEENLATLEENKAEIAAKDDQENKAVVYFEKGKNLTALKRFEEAERNYNLVLEWSAEKLDVLEALYDMYYDAKNYKAAIPVVKKLVLQDSDYKEDLANLYHRTKQYDKALLLLDELDEEWGESTYRNALRTQIYRVTGNTEKAISNLEEKITKNPKSEQEYLNLIYLYSDEGNTKKAFDTAKELIKQQPKSQLAHLALYKFYLDEGNSQESINSMNVVFTSDQIENKSRFSEPEARYWMRQILTVS